MTSKELDSKALEVCNTVNLAMKLSIDLEKLHNFQKMLNSIGIYLSDFEVLKLLEKIKNAQ